MIKEDLKLGDVLLNKQIAEVFQCSNQGGIRKSKKTNSIVVIAKFTDCSYKHKKIDNTLFFTGLGKRGDQEMKRQNKSLVNAEDEGFDIHVFEMPKPDHYIYMGRAKRYKDPFTERQLDDNGNDREVIIFPLEYIDKN